MSAGKMDLLGLQELMRYPEFNRIMAMAIGRWVSEEKTSEIEAYRRKREEFQEEAYWSLLLPEEKDRAVFYPPLYRFDITRYTENTWKVSFLDPLPPTHLPYFALLPSHVARVLAGRCGGNMDRLYEIVSHYPLQWNITVNFYVAQLSGNHVTGAFREQLDPLLYGVLNRPGGPSKADLAVMTQKFPYQVVLYCLDRYPEMQEPFYRAFHENLLPQLIEMENETTGKN